jgi:hypothetical protein
MLEKLNLADNNLKKTLTLDAEEEDLKKQYSNFGKISEQDRSFQ